MIELHPLTGIGEVSPGDDLGSVLWAALERARLAPRAGDVLVVTQKIVSKAEGRFVALEHVTPGARSAGARRAHEKGRAAGRAGADGN